MRNSTFLKSFLLLCALIVGSSSVWADYEEYYNLNCPKTSGNSAYATYYDVTVNGMTWNAPGNQNIDGGWRIGGKASSTSSPLDVDRTITGKTAMGSIITKVTFNHKGKSRANVTVPSVTLTVASDADFTNIIDEVVVSNPSITKDVANSFDFTPTSPLTEWAKDSYYKITINVTNSDTSNGGLDVTSIVFYKTVADKTPTTTAISDASLSNTDLKNGTTAGSLSANVTAGGSPVAGATVSWESGDEDVATIDENGVVTLVGIGTTTITASYAGNATYQSSSDTYELMVTDTREVTVTTIDATGLTNTDVYTSTAAGQLTASVTAGEKPVAGATVTWSSSDPSVATIDTEGNVTLVKKGITTITASYAGTNGYRASSDTYELTVIDSNAPLLNESVSKYTETGDSNTKITSANASNYLDDVDKWDYSKFSNAYAGRKFDGRENGCFKLGTSSNSGKIVTKEISLIGSAKLTFLAKQYKSGENAMTVSVTGATATGDLSVTAGSDFAEYTVYLSNPTADVVITFSSSSRIYLDDILLVEIENVPATVTAAGWATWVAPIDVTVPSGVEAYAVALNGNKTSLTALTDIPAGTPVLLKNEGTYEFSVATETPAAVTTALKVSEGVAVANAFVLAKKNDVVGFYRWIGSDPIPEGKVYLIYTDSAAPDFIGFGDATGIETLNVENGTLNGEVYNLAGQRVAQPVKGLYIVNGKKVIIK